MTTNKTPPPSEAADVLTMPEAAAFLRVTPQTVLRMLRANKLPAVKIGSRWRLSREALTRYLAGELVPTAPKAPAPVQTPRTVTPDSYPTRPRRKNI